MWEKQRGMTLFSDYRIISSGGSLLASKIFDFGKNNAIIRFSPRKVIALQLAPRPRLFSPSSC